MTISKILRQNKNAESRLYTAQELYGICCKALDETYLKVYIPMEPGTYRPIYMDEKYVPGYAQACSDQRNKICEIKQSLKEVLLNDSVTGD